MLTQTKNGLSKARTGSSGQSMGDRKPEGALIYTVAEQQNTLIQQVHSITVTNKWVRGDCKALIHVRIAHFSIFTVRRYRDSICDRTNAESKNIRSFLSGDRGHGERRTGGLET